MIDKLTATLIARVLENLPRDLEDDIMDGWTQNPKELRDGLRFLCPPKPYELYLAPGQQNGRTMNGFDLERHLKDTGRIMQAFSLEDKLVRGWLAGPDTYPDEFKHQSVFLWGSRRKVGSGREVAYLCWRGGRVRVVWGWLEGRWRGIDPSLLASSLAL